MAGKARKVTFALHEEVVAAVDDAVANGAAPSKNAFVEQALVKELKNLRRQARQALWDEAARDPLFLKDVEEIERDFDRADAESSVEMD